LLKYNYTNIIIHFVRRICLPVLNGTSKFLFLKRDLKKQFLALKSNHCTPYTWTMSS